MPLVVPFYQYWQQTGGEKVDYTLDKNQHGLWAAGFRHCIESHLCVGKIKGPFSTCKTIGDVLKIYVKILKFVTAGLILSVGTCMNRQSRRIFFQKSENKVFGKFFPT